MNSIFFTIGIAFVWLSSLFNGTGLGNAYRTNDITLAVFILLTAFLLLKKHPSKISRDWFFTFGGLSFIFVASSLLNGYGLSGLQFLCTYLMLFILSRVEVREGAFRLAGVVVLVLGAAILVIYDFGTQLSGWNENSIAMIGLFSYIIFMSAFYNLRSVWLKMLVVIVGAAFLVLILPTDSRSCMLMLLVTMLLAVIMQPCPRTLRSATAVTLLLLIPLIVAGIVAVLSLTEVSNTLESWSLSTFNKPIFNGRDALWRDAFKDLLQHPLFGTGNVNSGSWHNSAVACFTSFGILGYIFWVRSLFLPLKAGSFYLNDPIVTGCMTAFLLMNAQQAVELGMFSKSPNLLIYLPLGLVLGRVHHLKKKEDAVNA